MKMCRDTDHDAKNFLLGRSSNLASLKGMCRRDFPRIFVFSFSHPNSLFARLGDRLLTADSQNVKIERAREQNRRKNVDIAARTTRRVLLSIQKYASEEKRFN